MGGNGKTAIICTVNPIYIEETITTLKFAQRAKSVYNKPQMNKVAFSLEDGKGYKDKCKLLQERVAFLETQIQSNKDTSNINDKDLHILDESLDYSLVNETDISIQKDESINTNFINESQIINFDDINNTSITITDTILESNEGTPIKLIPIKRTNSRQDIVILKHLTLTFVDYNDAKESKSYP